MEQRKTQPKPTKFMNRNVMEFQHLIRQPSATQNDLEWVIQLRQSIISNPKRQTTSIPPEVYFKETASFKIRKDTQNKLKRINFKANEFDFMILKDQEEKPHEKQTQQQLQFYSSLRQKSAHKGLTNDKSLKQFSTIPFKDKNNIPTFLKKEALKKTKYIQNTDKQSALNNPCSEGPYNPKIVVNRNFAQFKHFTMQRGRNQVSLPQLAWQVGLRGYQ